jgi:hypothetical protein
VDLAPLAVQAGFCPAGDVFGKAAPDKLRRHKAPRGQLPRVGNAVQMQKTVFLEFCWDDGTKWRVPMPLVRGQASTATVRELMGWVRNVVLIDVYLDLENPRGSGFWVGGYMSQVRKWGS